MVRPVKSRNSKTNMKVKLISNVAHNTKILVKGSSHDLPDEVADSLIERKLAKEEIERMPQEPQQEKGNPKQGKKD
jgi:hypothetical protein